MKAHLIRQLITARVGKTLDITFVSGETVQAKVISAEQDLEEDVDFYFIDLARAPAVGLLDERADEDSSMRAHVYGGSYKEVREVEIPPASLKTSPE